jgi:hypothetical protein
MFPTTNTMRITRVRPPYFGPFLSRVQSILKAEGMWIVTSIRYSTDQITLTTTAKRRFEIVMAG